MELLARSGLTRLRLLLSEGVEPRRELVEPVQEGLKKRAWKTKKVDSMLISIRQGMFILHSGTQAVRM